MMLLDSWHKDYLDWLFSRKTLIFNNAVRPIIEAGQQELTLYKAEIRPYSSHRCMYVLEVIKVSEEERYVPIIKNYDVTSKDGIVNKEGQMLSTFMLRAFNIQVNFNKSNFIEVYELLNKCKKKLFNAVVGHNRELVLVKGQPVPDDSPLTIRLFGTNEFKCRYSSVMLDARTIDNPFMVKDYDILNVIRPLNEKDQLLIKNYK